ncbi:hypothetical protein, partial [Corynebacterium pseudotuberculosis]|uniref:hypothetical protein n=1 Tax=Corynebacterium pseudotuberculosis TaxID=1719 RepID=UPI002FFC5642
NRSVDAVGAPAASASVIGRGKGIIRWASRSLKRCRGRFFLCSEKVKIKSLLELVAVGRADRDNWTKTT